MKLTPAGRFVPLAVALLCVACACKALLGFQYDYRQWRHLQTWVETPARIAEVKLNGRAYHRKRGAFTIDGTYLYSVGGEEFEGSRIEYDDSLAVLGSAAYRPRLVNQMWDARSSGNFMTCYVDPAEPDTAVLLPAPPVTAQVYRLAWIVVVCGVGLAMFTLWCGLVAAGRRSFRRLSGAAMIGASAGCAAFAYIVFYAIVFESRAGTPGYPTVAQAMFGGLFGMFPLTAGGVAMAVGWRRLCRSN